VSKLGDGSGGRAKVERLARAMFLSRKNELDIELALTTMALYPDDEDTIAALNEHHNLIVTAPHLAYLRRQYPDRLQAARSDGLLVPD